MTAYAHPGRLDSNGGHNDYINGGYHYHTGDSDVNYRGPSEESSSMDSYTTFFLIVLFLLLVLCFYVLIKLRNSYRNKSSDSQIKEIPSLRPGITTDLIQSFQSDSVASHSPAPIPESSAPPDYILTARANQCVPHYIPVYLWECIDIMEYHIGYDIPIFERGYLWAVYFYVFAKTVRNQTVVDDLYSRHFEDAKSYFKDRMAGIDPYITMSNSYKRFAPVLNASGIDPRTTSGRNQLWDLLCQWAHFPDDCREAARKEFCLNCINLKFFVSKLYGTEHPVTQVITESGISPDSDIPDK